MLSQLSYIPTETTEVLFLAWTLSFSARSRVGSLFTSEEEKKVPA